MKQFKRPVLDIEGQRVDIDEERRYRRSSNLDGDNEFEEQTQHSQCVAMVVDPSSFVDDPMMEDGGWSTNLYIIGSMVGFTAALLAMWLSCR